MVLKKLAKKGGYVPLKLGKQQKSCFFSLRYWAQYNYNARIEKIDNTL